MTKQTIKPFLPKLGAIALLLLSTAGAFASEADIHIPDLSTVNFPGLGGISGPTLMYLGILLCGIGALFGIVQYRQTKALPVHDSMAKVSHTIWETCKTYLFILKINANTKSIFNPLHHLLQRNIFCPITFFT